MPPDQEKIPSKFNERFSTANRFLGPARAENPFVSRERTEEYPPDLRPEQEALQVIHSDRE
jgi:hypothetical protein